MRLISKLRGTNLEAATPASAPSGSELEGEAYSKRHRSPAPQLTPDLTLSFTRPGLGHSLTAR